eukprot:291313_1
MQKFIILLLALFTNKLISFSCANNDDCYANGECISGTCHCNYGFVGENCALINISPIVNVNQSITFINNTYISSWGGTPMQDPITKQWHLFTLIFKNQCDLHSWLGNGIIAHLISDNGPMGPWKFIDIAIDTPNNQTEIKSQWDGLSVYNPSIVSYKQNNGTILYLLYYTGTTYDAPHYNCTDGHQNKHNNLSIAANAAIGIAYSTSLNGPWIKHFDNPIITGNGSYVWNKGPPSNQAPLVLQNGSVAVMYKCGDNDGMYSGMAMSYNGWKGPYYANIQRTPIAVGGTCEDEYIWMNIDQYKNISYHLLFHCYCNEVHIYSYDLLNWNDNHLQHPWCQVNTTNGIFPLNRRERPSIAFEQDKNGKMIAKYLFNAVQAFNDSLYFNFVVPLGDGNILMS